MDNKKKTTEEQQQSIASRLGDVVVFIPHATDKEARQNGATEIAAIIVAKTQDFHGNVVAFPDGPSGSIYRTGVAHQSVATIGSPCYRYHDEELELVEGDPRQPPKVDKK